MFIRRASFAFAISACLAAACGDDAGPTGGTAGDGSGVAGSAGGGSAGTSSAGSGGAGTGSAGTGAGTGSAGTSAAGTGAISTDGQVTAAYGEYCVATFTQDYDVVDSFGDPQLTIATGAEYLIADFGTFKPDEVHVLYLSDAGPVELAIAEDASGNLPFTSTCAREAQLQSYIGIFDDVIVYADAERKQQKCTLTAGTILPGGSLSFQLVSDIFATPSVYEFAFDGLDTLCSGLTTGYLEAGTSRVGSTEETVLPFASFVGP